jgi:hypothetical protein
VSIEASIVRSGFDFGDLKINSAGDHRWEKIIEKAVLRVPRTHAFSHGLGHQRRFKRKPPTSAYPPILHIAASDRSATKSAGARRVAVNFAKLPELLRRTPPKNEA